MVGAGTEMTHFFRDRHALERLPVRLEELFALGVPACLHAIDLRGGPLVHGQAADKAEVRAERAVRPAALEAERDGEREGAPLRVGRVAFDAELVVSPAGRSTRRVPRENKGFVCRSEVGRESADT